MMKDLAPELGRRKRAAWGAYRRIEDVVKKTKNTRLRAHPFNTTLQKDLTFVHVALLQELATGPVC
ncbi:hypothetical protein ANCCEY_12795 [Ancylostoma ceylanicum]|uniref:Uncharacterized protein n=1 Tax=Ancylostoma ceylanicum TaxID=53326 RepID=A0A0D6L8W7_9BILA|nr:hypothetical protein ANCCEY_12795 [Ancylostoma ceylanicum]